MRRFLLALAVIAIVFISSSAQADLPWIKPVDGPVVLGFSPPQTLYGRGHLGVHFRVAPGTEVRAAGGGVVTFAGRVGSQLDVVVLRRGGLRTTYAFLATATVREGQAIVRGQVLGTTGGRGPGHDGTVLHFGLRRGDEYLDPMTLFDPVDLPRVVYLAPLNAANRAG